MSNKNLDFDWQNTQNDSYLDLCRERLDQPLLTWVKQFVNIINTYIESDGSLQGHVSINDYGCNVGHFFRGIADICSSVSYIGYDISRAYLNIAQSKFGSCHFQYLDFSKETAQNTIRSADVAIISATLEHVFDFETAIENIFRNTRSLVIIRTFIGSQSLVEHCRTLGAAEDYLIRQFTVDDIVRVPLAEGWNVSRLMDIATQGEFKLVCNSATIKRKQEIFVFYKKDVTYDFVDVTYDEKRLPLTDYPKTLSRYLFDRYKIQTADKFLDIGCGRGEFLSGFIDCGVQGYAVDQSLSARKYCPNAELRIADLENEGIPYPDNFFDVVYSKSVIEHFYYPERLIKEMYRVLKPGGTAITLCPAWEYNYRIFFEDYTHRTPFMLESLRDIQLIHGLENVQVEFFRQLPSTWNRMATIATPLAEVTRLITPFQLKKYSKWVRFSKEIMLLSSSSKPKLDSEERP